jgi:hypothetical protein
MVDLFAAANQKFIEDLDHKGLVRSDTNKCQRLALYVI